MVEPPSAEFLRNLPSFRTALTLGSLSRGLRGESQQGVGGTDPDMDLAASGDILGPTTGGVLLARGQGCF